MRIVAWIVVCAGIVFLASRLDAKPTPPPSPGPTFTGAGERASADSGNVLTPQLPLGSAPGDLLVAAVLFSEADGAELTTSTPGWTRLYDNRETDNPSLRNEGWCDHCTSALFWRFADGTEVPPKIDKIPGPYTGPTERAWAQVFRFRGVDQVNPFGPVASVCVTPTVFGACNEGGIYASRSGSTAVYIAQAAVDAPLDTAEYYYPAQPGEEVPPTPAGFWTEVLDNGSHIGDTRNSLGVMYCPQVGYWTGGFIVRTKANIHDPRIREHALAWLLELVPPAK